MLYKEITKLEQENRHLREALQELSEKMERNSVAKPKSCQYCMYYIQYYIEGGVWSTKPYVAINVGQCGRGIPIKKGGKGKTRPEDTCQYFEIGTPDMKWDRKPDIQSE